MASEVLLNISKDEAERARLMSEYKYELGVCCTSCYLMRKMRKNIVFEHFLPCKLLKEPKNREILWL